MREREIVCTHLLLAPESIKRGYCEACFQAKKPADWLSTERWKLK